MEYKFKTVYETELVKKCLVNCIPLESENRILLLAGYRELKAVGKIRECHDGSEFPVLPIFQYTGKKDCNGEEIYTGHILRKNDEDFEATVCFSEMYSCFGLKRDDVHWQSDNLYCHFSTTNLGNWKIIGHEALK